MCAAAALASLGKPAGSRQAIVSSAAHHQHPHLTRLSSRPPAQMSGCRARLEMVDGPRGAFAQLTLAGSPEAVACAQWLLGQRLSAAATYQLGVTTYYNYGPQPPALGGGMGMGFAPPGGMPPYMAAPWGQPPRPSPAGAMPQQQMMGGMMPAPLPMPLRQGSGGSGTSTPGA